MNTNSSNPTPQPNEPTAEAIAFDNFDADCKRGVIPTLCDMVQVGAYVRALRAENERLKQQINIMKFNHPASNPACPVCRGEIGVHYIHITELTQLRASLSTAVDVIDRLYNTLSAYINAEDWSKQLDDQGVDAIVYTQSILAQLRPLLAGKAPVAEVKAEDKRLDRVRQYIAGRRRTIEYSVASELIGGNEFKLACERTALAEITAIECELANLGSAQAGIEGEP